MLDLDLKLLNIQLKQSKAKDDLAILKEIQCGKQY